VILPYNADINSSVNDFPYEYSCKMEHLDKKKSSQEGLIKRSVILLDGQKEIWFRQVSLYNLYNEISQNRDLDIPKCCLIQT
jgi:hypothetical protein